MEAAKIFDLPVSAGGYEPCDRQPRSALVARRWWRPIVVGWRSVISRRGIVVAWRGIIGRWRVIRRPDDCPHGRGRDRSGTGDDRAGGNKWQSKQARAAAPSPSIVPTPRRRLGCRQEYRARHSKAHGRKTAITHCSNSQIACGTIRNAAPLSAYTEPPENPYPPRCIAAGGS